MSPGAAYDIRRLPLLGYGAGLNDYPSQTQIINSINSELQVLYQYGLNYYLAGSELIVSNSTCYDNFTNSSFRLNIGINISINCN